MLILLAVWLIAVGYALVYSGLTGVGVRQSLLGGA